MTSDYIPNGTLARTKREHNWYGYDRNGSKTTTKNIPEGTLVRIIGNAKVELLIPIADILTIPISASPAYFEPVV